jgi:hypothetical protein
MRAETPEVVSDRLGDGDVHCGGDREPYARGSLAIHLWQRHVWAIHGHATWDWSFLPFGIICDFSADESWRGPTRDFREFNTGALVVLLTSSALLTVLALARLAAQGLRPRGNALRDL